MRGPGTLTRYVVREVVAYTLLGLAAIGVILLARNLVRVLDELLGAGFAWSDLRLLLRVLGTMLLLYALPVSFLFGVLLAVGRMAGDVEIVAMRACGVGLRQLALPILVMGLGITAGTLWLSMHVEPAARRELRGVLASMVARGAGLEPGRFRRFGAVLVYVDARGGDRVQGIVVSDRRDPDRPLPLRIFWLVLAQKAAGPLATRVNSRVLARLLAEGSGWPAVLPLGAGRASIGSFCRLSVPSNRPMARFLRETP